MQVLLRDFVDGFRFYRLDPSTGEVAEERDKSEILHKTAGCGAYRRIGLRNRRRVFVALYSTGTTLILRLGDQVFDLGDKELTAERVRAAFLVGRFTIYRREAVILDWQYWFLEWQEWPDNGDIFSWIAKETATRESRLRSMYFFGASAEGRNIADSQFTEEMNKWVSQQMQQAS